MALIAREFGRVALGVGLLLGCSEPWSSVAEPARAQSAAVEIVPGVDLSDEFSVDLPTYEPAALPPSPMSFGTDAYLASYIYDQTYVARVDRDGTVLDPSGIKLATLRALPAPNVAFDGTSWVAVWTVYPDPSSFRRELRCARIQADGTVLDPEGALVNADTAAADTPYLFFDGTRFLFAAGYEWQFIDTACNPLGAPFSPFGQVSVSSLAFDGNGYVVLFAAASFPSGVYSLNVRRVSLDGAVVPGNPVFIDQIDARISVQQPFPRFSPGGTLASHLGTTVVAYHYAELGHADAIRYREIPSAGAPDQGLTLALTPPADFPQPGVVATDAGFVVSSPGADNRLDRVDFDEKEFLSGPLPPEDVTNWTAASDGERFLTNNSGLITVLDEDLVPLGPTVPLLAVAENETDPHVATSSNAALVVFDGDLVGLAAARVSKAGARLDASPLELGDHPANLSAVISNGTDFLAAWDTANPYRIRVRRVAADGTLDAAIDLGADVDSSSQQFWPTLTSNGSDFLVVWRRGMNMGSGESLMGTRISGSGAVLDASPLPLLTRDPASAAGLAAAFDGSNYLLAIGNEGPDPIRLGHVNPGSGAASWSDTPWTGFVRSLVWGDHQGLLVFQTSFNLFAARLDDSGNALDDPPITLSSTCCVVGNYDIAVATWDGSVYWTARIDKLRDGMPLELARLSPAGELLDADGITTVDKYLSGFGLGSWGQQQSVLAYSRGDYDPAFRSGRVRGRLLKPTGGPGQGGNGGGGNGGNGGAFGGTGGIDATGGTAGEAGTGANGGTDAGGVAGTTVAPSAGDGGAPGDAGASGTINVGGGPPQGGSGGAMANGGSGDQPATGGTSSAGEDGEGGVGAAGQAGSSGTSGRAGTSGKGPSSGASGQAGSGGSGASDGLGCGCSVPRSTYQGVAGKILAFASVLLATTRRRRRAASSAN